MARVLCIYLPRWELKESGARSPEKVQVLLDPASQQLLACNLRALSAGLRPGMSLPEAQARVSQVQAFCRQAGAARRALERLAQNLSGFSPRVLPGFADPVHGLLESLLVDLSGTEALLGPDPRRAIATRLRPELFRMAMAPSPSAAWALAWLGTGEMGGTEPASSRERTKSEERSDAGAQYQSFQSVQRFWIESPAELPAALDALPLVVLRLDEATRQALHQVGIEQIRQLRSLPRSALAARFGPALLCRWDQLHATLPEPWDLLAATGQIPPLVLSRLLDGPIDQLDTLRLLARSLLESWIEQLAVRECGVRHGELLLDRPHQTPLRIDFQTAHPTRAFPRLWALLDCQLQKLPLDHPIEALHLQSRWLENLPHAQTHAWSETPSETPEPLWDSLLETLHHRLGPRYLCQGHATHQPEATHQWLPVPLEGPLPPHQSELLPLADRPTRLLEPPESITFTGPMEFLYASQHCRITAKIGPERLSMPWWTGKTDTRDYYKVQESHGQWLWLFRRQCDHSWWLHGFW